MTTTFRRRLSLLPLTIALVVSGCGVFKGSGKSKVKVGGERVAILSGENDAAVEPALQGIAVALPAAVVNDAWSQPGGNAAKSIGNVALGAGIVRRWEARVAGSSPSARLAAAPVVANGALYAVGTDGAVSAFDAASGARKWNVGTATAKDKRATIYGGGVSVEGDVVYATNGLGDVVALKAADGATIWKKRLSAPLRGAPTVAFGNLYVLSQDNQLFALRTSDGNTEWTEAAAVQLAGVFGVAAPAAAQGTIVAGFSSGDLNAYRYENGRTVWQDALSRTSISTAVGTLSDIDADPVIDAGRIYAIGAGGRMVATELVTGQRQWELNIAGTATPAIAGEWLFVVTDDARLLCISRATGKVRWIAQLAHYRKEKSKNGSIEWQGPVLAGDRLYLVNSEGEMIAAAPEDGHILATYDVRAPISLAPVVANNMLYVLDDSGRITAFK